MRRALVLALAVAGCADGTSVLRVSVNAAPPLDAVDHLRVVVTDLARVPSRTAEPVFVPVAGALPPPVDFALVLPADIDGTVLLAVSAEEASNRVLAAAEERVAVRPSGSVRASLVLGTPGADLAVPDDLAGIDLAATDGSALPDLASVTRTPVRVARGANQMDILFVVDNSGTMMAKQALLKAALPSLMTSLRNFGATTPVSYHIGVITTDIGSGRFTVGTGCTRTTDAGLGGQGAKLVPRGDDAPADCAPPTGARWLVYDQIAGNDNSPDAGTDAGTGQTLERTLECMVSVGSLGCGFEQTLEATWQALRGGIPENAGFLRPDALLAIVFLTDEDDCSALPQSDLFNMGATQFGPFNSFRCTRHGIVCGSPAAPPPNAVTDGGLPGCRSATAAEGSQLYPIDRYTQLFGAPASQGGLKINPAEMIVSAIIGNPTPFDVVLATQGATGYLTPCAPFNGTTCSWALQRSCVAGGTIGADPAPRVLEAVNAAVNHEVTPICSSDYSGATNGLANMITSQLGPVCLPAALPDAANPDCVVEDVTANSDGTFTRQTIAACASNPSARPCWRLATNTACPALAGQQLSLVIDRAAAPPAATVPNAACKF